MTKCLFFFSIQKCQLPKPTDFPLNIKLKLSTEMTHLQRRRKKNKVIRCKKNAKLNPRRVKNYFKAKSAGGVNIFN